MSTSRKCKKDIAIRPSRHYSAVSTASKHPTGRSRDDLFLPVGIPLSLGNVFMDVVHKVESLEKNVYSVLTRVSELEEKHRRMELEDCRKTIRDLRTQVDRLKAAQEEYSPVVSATEEVTKLQQLLNAKYNAATQKPKLEEKFIEMKKLQRSMQKTLADLVQESGGKSIVRQEELGSLEKKIAQLEEADQENNSKVQTISRHLYSLESEVDQLAPRFDLEAQVDRHFEGHTRFMRQIHHIEVRLQATDSTVTKICTEFGNLSKKVLGTKTDGTRPA